MVLYGASLLQKTKKYYVIDNVREKRADILEVYYAAIVLLAIVLANIVLLLASS